MSAFALSRVCRDEVIPPAERELLPYYVKSQGMERGSYLCGWDGNRHLTTYEVHALLAGGQPRDDAVVFPEVVLADLDDDAVGALLERLRATRGKVFTEDTDEELLPKPSLLR